jgi:phage terminase large subunit
MSKGTAEFPDKLIPLFWPSRYKVAFGGRGSSKSWSFARALLIQGAKEQLRIACVREIQKSIKDSVHKLLKDQIEKLGLTSFYRPFETSIIGANGTEFLFMGLSNQTNETIKSLEGVDKCWVEEGQVVTKRSWDILIPTIRKDGSEIWVSFNPELETDDTYQRFVVNTPPDTFLCEINYKDNPWFNAIMERERLHCQATDPDDYANIWEGKCRAAVHGAIYHKEMQAMVADNRIGNVPYDPMLKVHVFFDLGWNDHMHIILAQRRASELRVIRAVEGTHQRLDEYSTALKELKLNWGKVFLPHDGFSGDYKTGSSSAAILSKLGWDVLPREEIIEASVEEGIKVARLTFPRVYIDKTHAAPLIEALKRYRRRINRQTEVAGSPVHDEASDGADCFRYFCLNAESMTNEADSLPRMIFAPTYEPLDAVIGY